MDTTETYIKMCEKAEEIHKEHEWIEGDWCWDVTNKEWYILCPCCHNYEHYPLSMYFWLPRQDQLQEMVKGDDHMHLLAYKFALYFHGNLDPLYWYIGVDNYTVDADNSMEQMWLAFVMKEKFNKVWDGENWNGK